MRNNHLIPILLTISVFVVCGLGFEYLSELDINGRRSATNQTTPRPATLRPPPAASEENSGAPPSAPASTSTAAPVQVGQPSTGGVYRCVQNGKTTYSDHPCPGEATARTVDVTPTSAGFSPNVPYQQQLAQVQQENQRTTAAVVQAPASTQQDDIRYQCKSLAEQIAWYDSALRKPHGAGEGDYWTQKRKAANDERFKLSCGKY